jgi:hypothetical protein
MSRQLKLILFVLAFNVIGFAEGYLLRVGARVAGADSNCDGVGCGSGESVVVTVSRWTAP